MPWCVSCLVVRRRWAGCKHVPPESVSQNAGFLKTHDPDTAVRILSSRVSALCTHQSIWFVRVSAFFQKPALWDTLSGGTCLHPAPRRRTPTTHKALSCAPLLFFVVVGVSTTQRTPLCVVVGAVESGAAGPLASPPIHTTTNRPTGRRRRNGKKRRGRCFFFCLSVGGADSQRHLRHLDKFTDLPGDDCQGSSNGRCHIWLTMAV
uniref:Secreted protein n=1 Tax=Panagrellus redivivus TaxID=6233 RepID=A0A7E4V7N7_PANRE